ncbi:MAG: beta-lactamase family protein [Acidobacteriota bacterium]|nr:beta-lactamase family protein [Acidobacteriota bacterium]
MCPIESPRPSVVPRLTAVIGAATAVCLVLGAASPPPAQAAPANGDWPRWESPEDAGFSSERLTEAEQLWWAIDDAPIAAFFLVHKGRVLAAFGDETADHQCHSVRKSFLSALYGIHVAKGTINLEATLEELGIDDHTPLTQAEKQAQVRDLLMARSGVYLEAACETPEMRDARPARGSHPPGTFWYYNNWDFNALGTIFRQETGRDIFAEFKRRIARPVGMQDFRASRCSYYYETQYSDHPCYVFRMSARDRARFGQLFLQRGHWEGRQLISEAWIAESTHGYSEMDSIAEIPGASYGYMWVSLSKEFFAANTQDRRLHHLWGFQASGYGGQTIYVLPDAEMVIVTACDVPAGCNLEGGEFGPVIETILTAREIVDLEARRPGVRERFASPGDTIHLKAKIKNRAAVATVATTVEFYLASTERLGEELHRLGDAELRRMAAGSRKTIRLAVPIPENLEPGSYRLIAWVDSDKANYDLRRDNNLRFGRRVLEIH